MTLADGTELLRAGTIAFSRAAGGSTSPGLEQGHTRRPHLTIGSELLGVGQFADHPDRDAEYREGYICGLIRGDAYLNSFAYTGRAGRTLIAHRFRLALADVEALDRTRDLLAQVGVTTTSRVFSRATATRREIESIATGRYATGRADTGDHPVAP